VQAQHAERELAAVDEPGRLSGADQHPTEHHIREHRKGGAGERLTLVSASVCAASIERYLGKGRPEALSQAAPEVMAIVAYEQPVTRADIRATRQVDSDAAVETLMARKLIAEDPRFGGRGRPSFLVTTELFLWSSPAFVRGSTPLRRFGPGSLADLPPRPHPDSAAVDEAWTAGLSATVRRQR
jgi:Segregation and condensation complex subunit ScpB